MKYGSLFSGIGGLDRGLDAAGMKCVWECECEPYASKVLEKHWPGVKRYGDIKAVNWKEAEKPDVICGGFPCQDISSSGNKVGINGKRSGLWFEFLRCVSSLRPNYVVVENVAALLIRGLDAVLGSLAEVGYDAEWHCLPAAVFGSPQRRDRVFIVAYPHSWRLEGGKKWHSQGQIIKQWNYHDGLALAQRRSRDASSGICRVDDGIPCRVHRLRCLGNAIYPAIGEMIGKAIIADNAT